jgi:hypothetical protein
MARREQSRLRAQVAELLEQCAAIRRQSAYVDALSVAWRTSWGPRALDALRRARARDGKRS